MQVEKGQHGKMALSGLIWSPTPSIRCKAPRGMVEWQSRDVCSCFILLRLSIDSSFALYREWKSTNTLSPLFSEVELCNGLYEFASFKHPQLMCSSLHPWTSRRPSFSGKYGFSISPFRFNLGFLWNLQIGLGFKACRDLAVAWAGQSWCYKPESRNLSQLL
jgi:hypothetical protein